LCVASIRSVVNPIFNRVLCPSYQGFRIYRETLSRFSCAASTSNRILILLIRQIINSFFQKYYSISISRLV
ncbi:hypothetical protein ACT6QE_08155, partial [Staphylococcus aureus]